jgi:hypothetical protein
MRRTEHQFPIVTVYEPLWTVGNATRVDDKPRQLEEERLLVPVGGSDANSPSVLAFDDVHATNVLREVDLDQANPVFLRIILGQRKTYEGLCSTVPSSCLRDR